MGDSQKEVEYISDKLFKDNSIVSYSQLSKDLGVPLSRSKEILYNFFKSNKTKLNASFIITGTVKGAIELKFVEFEDQVNEHLKAFDKVSSVHIYSLSLSEFKYSVKDLVLNQLKIQVSVDKLDYYYDLGMIKGPALVASSNSLLQPVKAEVVPINNSARSPTNVKQEPKKFNTGLSSGYVSRKQQKPAPIGSDITKMASTKRKAEPVPKYQYKSRKPATQKPDKVVMSHDYDNDDEHADLDVAKKITKEDKTKLSAMFEDDFSDNDGNVNELEEPIMAEDNEDENVELFKMEADEAKPAEVGVEEVEAPEEGMTNFELEQPQEPEYDEDGYIITHRPKPKANKAAKSANKPKAPSQNNAPTEIGSAPPSSKIAPKTGNKKQASLMNFFGKKK
ncbi:hypothetical protein PSN45_001902 [Yamadazyma tenuis]|nr:hypothetical protein PSN45_001902 [Yamadazyma tenuis]